jgi:hypothetical protein
MSQPVSLDGLRDEVARFGPAPYVVTVGDDGAPHAVSVSAGWDGDLLTASVGARTAANAAVRPRVSLLWSPYEPGGYSLIVDGAAEVDGEQLRVAPSKAVLHRPAGAGFEPASPRDRPAPPASPVTAEAASAASLRDCGSDCKPILGKDR